MSSAFRRAPFSEIVLRLFVYAVLATGCIAFWCSVLATAHGATPAIYVPFRWEVNTSRPARQDLPIVIGETVALEPTYVAYGQPVDLSQCYEVRLRYRSADMAAGQYYAITGEVTSATNGRVRVIWGPEHTGTNSLYDYDIMLIGADSASLKAAGKIKLSGGVGLDLVPLQGTITGLLDFATVEVRNADDAPFANDGDLLVIQGLLDDHVADAADANAAQNAAIQANTAGIASNTVRITSVETNLSAHIVTADAKNDEQDQAIAEAAAAATMGGDSSGPSTNMTVTRIRNIPVADLFPDAEDDGYGLKYDHATGQLLLGPVASEGTTISNIVVISSTASVTDVPSSSIGIYRTIRPFNLPSACVNVGGYEVAWFDLLGMTLRSGSLNLLGSWLTVNTKAYDGTVTAPSRTYAAQPDLGTYRFSTGSSYAEGFTVASNRVWYWDSLGIHLEDGKTINYTESDPLSIQASTTYSAWTHAGGTHATNAVVATSPLLTNGLAAVTWAATGLLSVHAESSTNQVDWIEAEATADPVYIRISVTNDIPAIGDETTTVSNIVATSWTRPGLVGTVSDTAGQVIEVDSPSTSRAAANKAYVDAAAAAVNPANWASYPASAPVNLDNRELRMGNAWTIYEVSESLYFASHGNPYMSFTAAGTAQSGLQIAAMSVSNQTATVSVSTNGVVSAPIIQWTPSLIDIAWQTLSPTSSTYPATNAAGHYEVIATLPASSGFVRAVQDAGSARADLHVPLYIQGQPVVTGFQIQGTNLLFVSAGVTNRISMEVLP